MTIEEHPFFAQFDAEHKRELIAVSDLYTYTDGDVIFEENSPSTGLFLVLTGAVDFYKSIGDAGRRLVSSSSAGEFFGEIGIFTGQPRSLQAVSRGDTSIAILLREELLTVIRRSSRAMENILESIINHLHETTRHYMDDMMQQEKMAVVGAMVNTIIHDFKNPFCLISLAAQIISQQHEDPTTRKMCKNIDDQIERMVSMAEELNMFTRGDTKLRIAPIKLIDLVDKFRELNFPYFENDNVAISVDIPDIVFEGEENKMLRVLQNLVSNAIDAMDKSGGEIKIEAHSRKEDFVLRISDNGKGIPPEIQERFFEPFVTYGKSKGTGLGSAIVRSIVNAHNGTITFTTEAGKGTTFEISLPYTQSEASAVA